MELNEILGEELFKQVSEKLGDKKLIINDGSYIPKEKMNEIIASKKVIQETLDKTNTELESIKKNVKGQDELIKQIETLQNGNKELDGKLRTQQLETAIKLKAIELKSKDKTGSDILALIDKSKVKLNDDGTVTGLEEVMKSITESKPYLFDVDGQTGGTGNPGQSGKGNNAPQAFQGIGAKLAEQRSTAEATASEFKDLYFK